jgi:hypothetical protein
MVRTSEGEFYENRRHPDSQSLVSMMSESSLLGVGRMADALSVVGV